MGIACFPPGRSDVPSNTKTQSYESFIVKEDRQGSSSSLPKVGTKDGEISIQRSTRLKRLGQDLLQMLEEYRDVSVSGNMHRQVEVQRRHEDVQSRRVAFFERNTT